MTRIAASVRAPPSALYRSRRACDSQRMTAPLVEITAAEAYAIAALFDGARRVAQSALCVLALEDIIDLGRDLEAAAILRGVELTRIPSAADADVEPVVAVTGTVDITLHPIEAAAIDLIGDGASVEHVMFELRRHRAMHELIAECVDAGLVSATGLKLRRQFATRARWEREVPVHVDLVDLAIRRVAIAVHGPLLLFESAPEIPLALGLRRRASANAWMMPGALGLGGGDFGGDGCADGGASGGGDC